MRASSAFRVKADVSIFHDRSAAQPGIVANVTVLGDYDDHQPDLIQSNGKKGRLDASRA
jgi:hypothetical protein